MAVYRWKYVDCFKVFWSLENDWVKKKMILENLSLVVSLRNRLGTVVWSVCVLRKTYTHTHTSDDSSVCVRALQASLSLQCCLLLQVTVWVARRTSCVLLWSLSSTSLPTKRLSSSSSAASCSSPTPPPCAGKPTVWHCISTGTYSHYIKVQ